MNKKVLSEKEKAIKEFMEDYQSFELSENGVPLKPPMVAIKNAFVEGYEVLEAKLIQERVKNEKLQKENQEMRLALDKNALDEKGEYKFHAKTNGI